MVNFSFGLKQFYKLEGCLECATDVESQIADGMLLTYCNLGALPSLTLAHVHSWSFVAEDLAKGYKNNTAEVFE